MTNNYTSRDFYLAAYLVASGIELSKHERIDGLTTFYFYNSQALQNLVNDFYALKAVVNPVTYGNALRNLKTIIHASSNTNTSQNSINVKQSIGY